MADPTRRNPYKYPLARRRIADGRWVVDPDAGTIWSRHAGKFLSPKPANQGYLLVSIWDPELKRRWLLAAHLVIWESVHGPIDDLVIEVNHRDGNKLNNSIHNLELATPFENTWHSAYIGLTNHRLPQPDDGLALPDPRAQRNAAKLTLEQVIEIRRLLGQQVPQQVVADQYGISQAQVSNIWRGQSWARVPVAAM